MNIDSFQEALASCSDEDLQQVEYLVLEAHYRKQLGFATYKEVADIFRPHPPCSNCKFIETHKNGHERNGLLRFVCPQCNKQYNQLTGTIFEHSKYPFVMWLKFLELMIWNMPLEGISELLHISTQTLFEWRHRVFKAVADYQNELVLEGLVWIDETYLQDWEATDRDEKKRGLSKQKYCITLAIDTEKHIFAFISGKGKPSSKRICDTLVAHIAPKTTIIHDKERAHKALIKALEATDLSYKADMTDPEYITKMSLINYYCAWIKRYLGRHIGMGQKEYLQDYLN